jgi:hypothetical protein
MCILIVLVLLQVYNRSGYQYLPEAIAHIPNSGLGVVDTSTGKWHASQTSYFNAVNIPRSYALRYMDGPFRGRTLGNVRQALAALQKVERRDKEEPVIKPVAQAEPVQPPVYQQTWWPVVQPPAVWVPSPAAGAYSYVYAPAEPAPVAPLVQMQVHSCGGSSSSSSSSRWRGLVQAATAAQQHIFAAGLVQPAPARPQQPTHLADL